MRRAAQSLGSSALRVLVSHGIGGLPGVVRTGAAPWQGTTKAPSGYVQEGGWAC
ncbi:hypothetical protein GMYAFLOJ_CDS0082 [Microbacterium phage phiMiGM15]